MTPACSPEGSTGPGTKSDIYVVVCAAQMVPVVREMARDLRQHACQLRQWATLVTPAYEDAAYDEMYKELLASIGDGLGQVADVWMDSLTSYHASRAQKVYDVRRPQSAHSYLSYDTIRYEMLF